MENLLNNSKSINFNEVELTKTAKFTEFQNVVLNYDSGTMKRLRSKLRDSEKLTFEQGKEEEQILNFINAGKGLRVKNGFLFISSSKVNGDYIKLSITDERIQQLKSELKKGTEPTKANKQ